MDKQKTLTEAHLPLYDRYAQWFNTTTQAIHVVSIDADGTETDLGAITQTQRARP